MSPKQALMSLLAAGLLAASLPALADRARSGRPTLHRCHVAARVLPQVGPLVRHNARATMPLVVAKPREGNELFVGHGTGFLVSGADAAGRALVMTNEHVVDRARGQFAAIQVKGKALRGQTRVVASSKTLDYALLEVSLPAGIKIPPVSLAPMTGTLPQKVYCVGYPTVSKLPPRRLGGSSRSWQHATPEVRTSPGAHPALAQSDALARSPQVIALGSGNRAAVAKQSRESNTAYFDLPGAPGASGSPVFCRATHAAVGLLYGASPTTRKGEMAAAVTPMYLIVKDLRQQIAKLTGGDKRSVQRLLDTLK